MAAPQKIIYAGLGYVHYGALAAGAYYPAGLTGVVANGQIEPLVRLQGAKSLGLTIPEAVRVTQTGDDQPQGTFIFRSTENPTGTLNMGILDLDYENMVQGTTLYTVGDSQISALAPGDPVFVDHLMLVSRPAKSKSAATSGQSQWHNYLIPLVNAAPRGDSSITEREVADAVYDLVINPATFFPWGLALGATNVGTTEVPIFRITTKYPLMIETLSGDNSEDEFTLDKLPVSDHSGDYLHTYDYSDGSNADDELTSVSTTTGLMTYTAAPGTGVKRVVVYQWNPALN